MWGGIFNASLSCAIWSGLAMAHITILTVTIFLHRSQSHRAVDLHKGVMHFFRFWAWFTTGMITKRWVAVHRKHHAKAETQDDPHSPLIHGIRRILFNGVAYYRNAGKVVEDVEKYGFGTPDDWLEDNIYTPLHRIGILFLLAMNITFFGVYGLATWLIQILWIPFWAAGVVNGVAHYVGYRNFEVSDNSRNVFPIGIIIGGEELHNNHHAYGASAKFSVKWYEFDSGWMVIRGLEKLGLAKVNRTIPVLDSKDNSSEKALVQHVLYNKIQLIEKYCKQVIKPVFKEGEASSKFPQAKKLLTRNLTAISIDDNNRIDVLLQRYDNIKVVYEARKKLEEICKTNKKSFAEIHALLQEWCKNAEDSGIDHLASFSFWLKGMLVHNEG